MSASYAGIGGDCRRVGRGEHVVNASSAKAEHLVTSLCVLYELRVNSNAITRRCELELTGTVCLDGQGSGTGTASVTLEELQKILVGGQCDRLNVSETIVNPWLQAVGDRVVRVIKVEEVSADGQAV